MNILAIDPLASPDWDKLLQSVDRTTFFHTSAWARVLVEAYGYQPCYFAAFAGGRLDGLIPLMEVDSFLTGKRGVSLPFTDTCHPIAGSDDAFQKLLRRAWEHGNRQRWRSIELRGGGELMNGTTPCAVHSTHLLQLSQDEDGLKKSFRESTRRNIRYAEKAGVEVRLVHTREALADFYRLHCLTRQHHGLPPQPWSFFSKIYEHIIAHKMGFVALGLYLGRPVAGAVYFCFRDQALYKFSASDRRYPNLRANYLVMWETIRWLIRNGFHRLDFGRTELENYGLFQFKNGWRATEFKMGYYRMHLRKKKFSTDRTGIPTSCAVFKLLPIAWLKLIGRILYRHMG